MTRSPTIEDVARVAGVSVATVSRALRDLPNVAPATRQRVRVVATELNYRADPSASALASGRTKTAAMAVPMLDSWYFSKVMAGAEAVLTEAGYDLLVFAVDADERRRRLFQRPLVKRADGLIIVDLHVPADEARELLESRIEVVAVGMELPGAAAVLVDDYRLAFEAVSHLASLGHSRIALIGGLSDRRARFLVPTDRRRGFLDALESAGLEACEELMLSGDFSISGGRKAMARLLALPEPPTAVFAMSDEMALGVLRELWDRGMEAPTDVSVIGVDDHDLAELIGLTTMQQQVVEHGTVAARLLLRRLDGEDGGSRVYVDTALVERSSAGPAPR